MQGKRDAFKRNTVERPRDKAGLGLRLKMLILLLVFGQVKALKIV